LLNAEVLTYSISGNLIISNFSNFILNIQVNIWIKHQSEDFYLKNHEDNFDERYHLNDKFIIFYLK
jgi:hypothetical protein